MRQALVKQQRGELTGLIQIEATADGEEISIMGAFADHMQYGALALIKTLGILSDKITDSGEVGYASSPTAVRHLIPRKKRGPARAFVEITDLAPLELPRRKR